MNYTALIVDDEAHIRRTIRKIGLWEQLGVEVIGEASDGLQAFQMISEYRPDIVLLDMRMPGMDGLELLKQLERFELSSNIIIVSGHDDYVYMHQAIRFGAKDYILKPIDREAFNASLGRVVSRLAKDEDAAPAAEDETGTLSDGTVPHLDLISRIYEYIIRNYRQDLSLSNLSQQFFISKEFLSRAFKKRYDIGITTFINQIRINKAKEHLRKGSKVHAAAEAVGLEDVNYFSKLFKKHTHMTPSEFVEMFKDD
ncbi:response regulator transcription factor [Cohnella caldifontis]|uniref:response regulator transcription factor n=1 Tax=Cohnella caldifontis TaxID=3027471 RepID=UPI0023EB0839|nr:response regulator [Cohnella sp. YIM B05605]